MCYDYSGTGGVMMHGKACRFWGSFGLWVIGGWIASAFIMLLHSIPNPPGALQVPMPTLIDYMVMFAIGTGLFSFAGLVIGLATALDGTPEHNHIHP